MKNKKVCTLAVFCTIAAVMVMFAGCSGSTEITGESESTAGSYRLKVATPQDRGGMKIIPSGTEEIFIEITGNGIEEGDPLTSSAPISASEIIVHDIPAGSKVAKIQALDADLNILSQKKHSFIINNGETTESESIKLGVAIKEDGGNIVFEPSELNLQASEPVPFQNWTSNTITVTGINSNDTPIPGISTGVQGMKVFHENEFDFTESDEAGAAEDANATCNINIPPGQFIFVIDVPSNNYKYGLPLIKYSGMTTWEFTVDWGDGTVSDINSYDSSRRFHTYSSAGEYTVKISGICHSFDVNDDSHRNLYKSVVSWGNVGFKFVRFEGCSNLESLPEERGRLSGVIGLSRTFEDCSSLTKIPEGIFDNCTEVEDYCNNTFRNCTQITSIPEDLFADCTEARVFLQTFQGCPGITSIPEDLFRYNTNAEDFRSCFNNTSITAIPEGLFRYNTAAVDFGYCFRQCPDLAAIPGNLFKYNTLAERFVDTFRECPGLTSVPENLFAHNSEINSFSGTFKDSGNISSIPENLFENNTKAGSFRDCFRGCTSLTTNPENLFTNNTEVLSFHTTFSGCYNLTGTAPELWRRYPRPTGYGCFNDCTGLTNYSSIPSDWN